MANTSLAYAERDERRRTILREAERRFWLYNEILDDEEWLLLRRRIKRLKRQLGL
jgi:hypothetical protein